MSEEHTLDPHTHPEMAKYKQKNNRYSLSSKWFFTLNITLRRLLRVKVLWYN